MTKTHLAVAFGLALCVGGVAAAQTMAPPSRPDAMGAEAAAPADGPGHGPGGGRPGGGMGRMMGEMMDHMHPSKAASFHLRKGDARVDIKCADDEPTKACIDAASALLDKLATQPK